MGLDSFSFLASHWQLQQSYFINFIQNLRGHKYIKWTWNNSLIMVLLRFYDQKMLCFMLWFFFFFFFLVEYFWAPKEAPNNKLFFWMSLTEETRIIAENMEINEVIWKILKCKSNCTLERLTFPRSEANHIPFLYKLYFNILLQLQTRWFDLISFDLIMWYQQE